MPNPLDQTGLLCDPFYELRTPLGRHSKGHPIVQPGQLVCAHQVYPADKPWVIEVKGYDPRDLTKKSFIIKTHDPHGPQKSHFPIKELNLRADENLYVMYGKFRPAIVLQTISTDFYNLANPEPYIWVAPCFTFKDKHKQSYRLRVAALQLPHLFYLPTHPHGYVEPGVLRFEHVQPVKASTVEPVFRNGQQTFLSGLAWGILQHQLIKFMTGKVLDADIEETLRTYAQLVLEAYSN